LFPILLKNLSDNDDELHIKLETLTIIRTLLKTELEMETFRDNAKELLEYIISFNASKFNKVITEGLKLSAVFSHIISSDPDEESSSSLTDDMSPLILKL